MKKTLLFCGVTLSALLSNAQQRVPLFEVFTSSTCGPCKPGNAVYEGVIAGKPESEYVGIKYQQNFPGDGDPYGTTETITRRGTYYAINSIPRMEIDGGWDQNASLFTSALYTSSRAVPAKFDVTGTFYISGKTVTAKVKYSPLAVPTGAKLYVAIVEDTTINNKKSNGETAFYKVVKKMLPTDAGTSLPTIAVGKYDSTSFTFTFAGSYRLPPSSKLVANRINDATEHSVENFKNLKVVAWVQGSTKEVYQAANLVYTMPTSSITEMTGAVTGVNIYPNPAQNFLNIELNMKERDQVSAQLISMNGAVVATTIVEVSAGLNQIAIDTKDLSNGFYNLVILDSKNNSTGQMISVAH